MSEHNPDPFAPHGPAPKAEDSEPDKQETKGRRAEAKKTTDSKPEKTEKPEEKP